MKGTLHHVSVVTRDLDRARAFYCDRLRFEQVARPAFPGPGAWLRAGGLELHLILYPTGTMRRSAAIDANDVHFAMRVDNFDDALAELHRAGFRESAELGDPDHLLVKRDSLAGYGQIYLRDCDHNIIEINAHV